MCASLILVSACSLISPASDGKVELPPCAASVLAALQEWDQETSSFDLSYVVELREEAEAGIVLQDRAVRARAIVDGERRRFASSDLVARPEWRNCSPNEWDVSFDGVKTVLHECGVYIEHDGFHKVFGHVLPKQAIHINGLRSYLEDYEAGRLNVELSCEEKPAGHHQIRLVWSMDKHGPGIFEFAQEYVMHRDHPYMLIEHRSYRKGGAWLNSEVVNIHYDQLESGVFYPVRGRENMLSEDGRVWRSEAFEVLLAESTIGSAPLSDELFNLDPPSRADICRPAEEQLSLGISPCGSTPAPCADEETQRAADATLDKLAERQDELSASLAGAVAMARDLRAPAAGADSTAAGESSSANDRGGIQGWRAGAWGGVGALFAVASALVFLRLVRFSAGRRGA